MTGFFVFIITFIFDTFLMLLLLRFLLQWVKADFYNPLSQATIRFTNFLVMPLRRFVPGLYGHDLSTFVAWLGLTLFKVISIAALLNYPIKISATFLWTLRELLSQTVDLYFYAILLRVILSWLNTTRPHPIMGALVPLTEPLLRPFRRAIPPIAGFDLSTLFAILALQMVTIFAINPLAVMAMRLLK